MNPTSGQQEFFSSLIFQPRSEERQGVPDYRSPRPSRSPSATPAYGRTTYFREGSTRRRGSTPPADQATPPPPTDSLWLSKSPAGTQPQLRDIQQKETPAIPTAVPAAIAETPQALEDTWVTVFGFQPGDMQAVLREFTKCGDITKFGSGRHDSVNWVHIHYANKYQAQRAVQRNGDLLNGHLMLGVQRLDARHRAVADGLLPGQSDALPSTPSALPVRPYRVDAPRALDIIPQPSLSTWARVNEYVFGL